MDLGSNALAVINHLEIGSAHIFYMVTGAVLKLAGNILKLP